MKCFTSFLHSIFIEQPFFDTAKFNVQALLTSQTLGYNTASLEVQTVNEDRAVETHTIRSKTKDHCWRSTKLRHGPYKAFTFITV